MPKASFSPKRNVSTQPVQQRRMRMPLGPAMPVVVSPAPLPGFLEEPLYGWHLSRR